MPCWPTPSSSSPPSTAIGRSCPVAPGSRWSVSTARSRSASLFAPDPLVYGALFTHPLSPRRQLAGGKRSQTSGGRGRPDDSVPGAGEHADRAGEHLPAEGPGERDGLMKMTRGNPLIPGRLHPSTPVSSCRRTSSWACCSTRRRTCSNGWRRTRRT